jgi:hypothetical protein
MHNFFFNLGGKWLELLSRILWSFISSETALQSIIPIDINEVYVFFNNQSLFFWQRN